VQFVLFHNLVVVALIQWIKVYSAYVNSVTQNISTNSEGSLHMTEVMT